MNQKLQPAALPSQSPEHSIERLGQHPTKERVVAIRLISLANEQQADQNGNDADLDEQNKRITKNKYIKYGACNELLPISEDPT